MQIQVNTDRHIDGNESVKERVRDVVARSVERFSDRITRIEVHLADVNSGARSGPDDIRCRLEARLAGLNPLTVSHNAATVDQAAAGAAEKLEKALGRNLERLERTRGRTPFGGEEVV